MTIKSKTMLWTVGYFLVLSGFSLRLLLIGPSIWWPVGMEAFVIVITISLFRYRKKREIRFRSDENGILFTGSKGGLYDPDYLRYGDLRGAARDHDHIVLTTIDGRTIRLIGLKRHADAIVSEIEARLPTGASRNRNGGFA